MPRLFKATTSLLNVALSLTVAIVTNGCAVALPYNQLDTFNPDILKRPVLVFGELHGTNEIPAFVSTLASALVAQHKPVIVGLEIPVMEQSAIDLYLESAGSRQDIGLLTEGKFWTATTRFGVSGDATVRLIDDVRRLKMRGANIRILAFDPGPAKVAAAPGPDASRLISRLRDEGMAAAIGSARKDTPGAAVIVLVGSVHASKAEGAPWDAEYRSMGSLLAKSDDVLTFAVAHDGGNAWNCTPDCGVHEVVGTATRGPARLAIDDRKHTPGFDGEYYVGTLSASMPARPPVPPGSARGVEK